MESLVNSGKDRDLLLQLKRGSLDALGELYDRHRLLVYRTALVILGDHEAASDLLQDVFLRLYRFADHIDFNRPLEPWLYRMTTNLCYTWLKRNRRWALPVEDLLHFLMASKRNLPDEVVERLDDWQNVQKAVAELPWPQRVVVVLYYLNDLSIEEIAEVLNIPPGTVKSRLHYSRRALRRSLERAYLPEGDRLPGLEYEGSS